MLTTLDEGQIFGDEFLFSSESDPRRDHSVRCTKETCIMVTSKQTFLSMHLSVEAKKGIMEIIQKKSE